MGLDRWEKRIIRKLWFNPFDVVFRTSPSAKLRTGPRRLSASPCHAECNEGSEPSQTRPWLSQMLRGAALSEVEWAQHDNSVEGVSHLVFLASSDIQWIPSGSICSD